MNRLLAIDSKVFDNDFPSAAIFLTTAHLRFELFAIAKIPQLEFTFFHRQRAQELLQSPACSEYKWFMDLPEIKRIKKEIFGEEGGQ